MFKHKNRLVRFIEFIIIGVLFGVVEDLIAIFLATDAEFNVRVVLTALFVAVPFAYFSEYIVDHPAFWKKILPKSFFTKEEIVIGDRKDN